jgi:hypothetical protein
LIDCLTLCVPLLARLGKAADWFYGDHRSNAEGLLQERRTEIEHQVASKKARADMVLRRLEEELEPSEFDEVIGARESAAEYEIDPNDYGSFPMYAISQECPECEMQGRLIGEVDVTHEVETAYEGPGHEYFFIDLIPRAFVCNGCKLTLHGQQELQACDIPSSRLDVQDYQLGPDFNPRAED